jgi:hypothetical protein
MSHLDRRRDYPHTWGCQVHNLEGNLSRDGFPQRCRAPPAGYLRANWPAPKSCQMRVPEEDLDQLYRSEQGLTIALMGLLGRAKSHCAAPRQLKNKNRRRIVVREDLSRTPR